MSPSAREATIIHMETLSAGSTDQKPSSKVLQVLELVLVHIGINVGVLYTQRPRTTLLQAIGVAATRMCSTERL